MMARPLPHARPGAEELPATPPPLGGTPSHPLLAGTRALNPLPMDFSTLLSALPQGRKRITRP